MDANEALQFGLVNRVVKTGTALTEAIRYATDLTKHPQLCLRKDREMVYRLFEYTPCDLEKQLINVYCFTNSQWDMPLAKSLEKEGCEGSNTSIISEAIKGASVFSSGKGRKGKPVHT